MGKHPIAGMLTATEMHREHNIINAELWIYFSPCAGDLGDEDLEHALNKVTSMGRHVALVVFGHNHEDLLDKGEFGKRTW